MKHKSNDTNNFSKKIHALQLNLLTSQVANSAFLDFFQSAIQHPQKIEEVQKDFFNKFFDFQTSVLNNFCSTDNNEQNHNATKTTNEKNTNQTACINNNPMISFIHQYYNTVSSWMIDSIKKFNIDENVKHRTEFFLKQYLDMLSPNNFPFFNQEFINESIKTNGENIKKGMALLMKDMKKGTITTTDKRYFKIGDNIASTKGKVVYQNDLIELIQYESTTPKVFEKPILFIPPWINKFYILDLTQETSFVKWAVDNGFTTFMISWVNPNKKHQNKGFTEYANEGLLSALDTIAEITKAKSLHTIGYCVGGTLISSFLAYIANPMCKVKPKITIESATLLTTLLDFSKSGDLSIFMAEQYLQAIEKILDNKGYLDGQVMFNTFSTLKANDMIWRYFINSYMLGKAPPAHEMLFWNSDPVNISKAMQIFLSKDLYRDNLLKTGTLKIEDVPIDFKLVHTPLYMISMFKDHLVPWKATFDNISLFNKNIRFVLGGSGHVAGVVNHPSKNKYCYWTNDATETSADEWLNHAKKSNGSWWIDWLNWITPMMGKLTDAPSIQNSIRNAPGLYVKS